MALEEAFSIRVSDHDAALMLNVSDMVRYLRDTVRIESGLSVM